MKTLLIIPTLNEVDNVPELVTSIWHHLPGAHLLFVDDNSQDGTRTVIDTLRSDHPGVVDAIYRERKLGLGTAYVAGFQWALQRDYEVVIEIDADLSHDPVVLPRFVQLLESYDVVIGSRYIPGGGTRNWGPIRQVISRLGGVYARAVLGMQVRDPTGGYNGWRRSVLERIEPTTIRSEGYSFQIELKYRAARAGFSWIETPIIFEDRRTGQSKMSNAIIIEAMLRLWSLRWDNR